LKENAIIVWGNQTGEEVPERRRRKAQRGRIPCPKERKGRTIHWGECGGKKKKHKLEVWVGSGGVFLGGGFGGGATNFGGKRGFSVLKNPVTLEAT